MTMHKKNVLITGGSRGIGFAIACRLAESFNVFITGRNSEKIEKLALDNGFAGAFTADFYDEETARNLIINSGIDFDVLINNAGVYYYTDTEKMSFEELTNTLKLNALAPFLLMQQVIPYMKQQKNGRIINIGSISGVTGEASAAAYSMTKAALIGLTKSTALELAQYNITVNVINPGWVDTELICNENLESDFSKEEILETIPGRRFVTPEEIAQTCEFLISDSAKSITGQSINICAGLSLGC